MDYQSNSKKLREEPITPPDKKIESVTTSKVIIKKKSLGKRFREVFIKEDIDTVVSRVLLDVIVPSLKNMFVDSVITGVKRISYGDSTIRRGPDGRPSTVTVYNSPINRQYVDPRHNLGPVPGVTSVVPGRGERYSRTEFILASRDEAAMVLEKMNDILDQYDVVSVADLNQLVELPAEPIDNKWGWGYLGNANIRQIREGFLLVLPEPEPI